MKNTYLGLLSILTLSFISLPSKAQFLKNLVNNVKQSVNNKAVATVPASRTDTSKKKNLSYDSTKMANYLAHLGPTNSSISPADSAAALKAFSSASGGNGLFYRYLIHTEIKMNGRDSSVVDTMSQSISMTTVPCSRSEFRLMGMPVQSLGHGDQLRYSILLYPKTKTYVVKIIDTSANSASDRISYKATRIGVEMVQGYSCIHSTLTSMSGSSKLTVMDCWTSTSVPGYAELKKMMAIRNVTKGMLKALEDAGCNGLFVKMKSQSKAYSMEMVLVNAEHKTFPASTFEIPPGYSSGSNSTAFGDMMQLSK